MAVRFLALALAAVLAGCTARAAVAEPVRIPVTMTEFSFGSTVFEVPAGSPIQLAVTNAGTIDHDLVIAELGVRALLRPGRSTVVDLRPLSAGTYLIDCSIPTHHESGMVATLIVR